MSVIVFAQYLGMFGGPIFFSSIADRFGWDIAAYALVMLGLTAFFASLRLKIK